MSSYSECCAGHEHAELSVLQVEHWKEQAGLSPAQRQFVDLSDIQDARNLPEHEDH